MLITDNNHQISCWQDYVDAPGSLPPRTIQCNVVSILETQQIVKFIVDQNLDIAWQLTPNVLSKYSIIDYFGSVIIIIIGTKCSQASPGTRYKKVSTPLPTAAELNLPLKDRTGGVICSCAFVCDPSFSSSTFVCGAFLGSKLLCSFNILTTKT